MKKKKKNETEGNRNKPTEDPDVSQRVAGSRLTVGNIFKKMGDKVENFGRNQIPYKK